MVEFKNLFLSKTLTGEDWFILKTIQENPKLGTINLAKKIGISPKNLIARLTNYKNIGWIIAESVPVKPKGAKKLHKITSSGIMAMEKFKEALDLADENIKLRENAAKKLGRKYLPLLKPD